MIRTKETLKASGDFGVAIFDNSQLIELLKFQRNAKSSSVTLTTSRCFLKPMLPTNMDDINFGDEKVPITYHNQIIPSPYNFPAFELDNRITKESFNPNRLEVTGSTDLSGARVEAYARVVVIANIVAKMRKIIPFSTGRMFEFQHLDNENAIISFNIPTMLKENRTPNNGQPTFYSHAATFQFRATELWRGEATKTSLLMPPVSPEDETTNLGAAKVVLSLLVLFGILELQSNEGAEGNVRGIRLADGYDKRYLMLVGDGLSQIRVRTFVEMIGDQCYDLGQEHESTVMIRKALGQIINVTGDLHGGCFHFLQAVFNLFYGSLIQPIQTLLGWKRIRGTDVTKCYQQAAGLAIMIADELERHLFGTFFSSKVEDNEWISRLRDVEKDSKAAAIFIAVEYDKWTVEQRRTTNDEYFLMSLNFCFLMNQYRLFRKSLRSGDAIMVEWLYTKFLPIYLVTNKFHYFEIVLSMIDELYDQIPARMLHLVRMNRTSPLYAGVDKDGNPMANWSLDGIIELLQKFYHKMGMENNMKGWFRHSSHAMLKNKCERFVGVSYSRGATAIHADHRSVDHVSENVATTSPAGSTKRTAIPSRVLEKHAIAEFLFLIECAVNQPARKYGQKHVWSMLSKVKTELLDETELERTQRWMKESMMVEDIALSDIADILFNVDENNERNDEDADQDVDRENDDMNVVLDPLDIGRGGERDGTDDEDNDLENGDDVPDDDVEQDFTVGPKRRKVRVRWAAANKLGFIDVESKGIEMLQGKNLTVRRYRKKNRAERMRNFKKSIYEDLEGNAGSSAMVNEAFLRLNA